MSAISVYTAKNIEDVFNASGLEAAQERYRAWYIKIKIYARYKDDCDAILSQDGYVECIVTA